MLRATQARQIHTPGAGSGCHAAPGRHVTRFVAHLLTDNEPPTFDKPVDRSNDGSSAQRWVVALYVGSRERHRRMNNEIQSGNQAVDPDRERVVSASYLAGFEL